MNADPVALQRRIADRRAAQQREEFEMRALHDFIHDPCKPLSMKLGALARMGELAAAAAQRLLDALEDAP